jgi:predicted nicotinamide N-methyase
MDICYMKIAGHNSCHFKTSICSRAPKYVTYAWASSVHVSSYRGSPHDTVEWLTVLHGIPEASSSELCLRPILI